MTCRLTNRTSHLELPYSESLTEASAQNYLLLHTPAVVQYTARAPGRHSALNHRKLPHPASNAHEYLSVRRYGLLPAHETLYRRSVRSKHSRPTLTARLRHGEPPPQKPSRPPSGSSPSRSTEVPSRQSFIIASDSLHNYQS